MKVFAIIAMITTLLFGSVDINTANKAELMTLKGVGAKKADAIITYRAAHCFKSVKAITNVKGIGAKFLEKNKANLEASECK